MYTLIVTSALLHSGFFNDESGAVTVDWVVMTAAVVGLAVMLFSILAPAIFQDAAQSIADVVVAAAARP